MAKKVMWDLSGPTTGNYEGFLAGLLGKAALPHTSLGVEPLLKSLKS